MRANFLIEKTPPGRSEDYKDYIRKQPCWVCRLSPSEPHHTQTAGTSIKGSDFSCIPLCTKHHREAHDMGRIKFETERIVVLAEAVTHHLIKWADRFWGDTRSQ